MASLDASGSAVLTAEFENPDCDPITLNVTVEVEVTIAPTVGDTTTIVDADSENNPVTLDIDGYEIQFVAITSGPSNGAATVSASGTEITYTPKAGFSGTDSFTYTATNAAGDSNTATAKINVEAATHTVSWSLSPSGTSTISATVDGTPLSSGDPVPLDSVVEFLVNPRASQTYSKAPSGCGVSYIDSDGPGDRWRTDPVTTNCSVTFPIDRIIIVPLESELPEAIRGQPYEGVQFTTQRGYDPFTDWSWTLVSANLPAGLFLNRTTGNLSGTPTETGTFYFHVEATNSARHSGLSPLRYELTVIEPAENVDLSGLDLSEGTLSPGFDSGTTSYAVSVPYATETITVTPTVDDPGATIAVNGQSVASGGTSPDISLVAGNTTITVEVTAQNETTTKTYTITVTREGPEITLGPNALPAGSAGANYTASFTADGGAEPYGFAVTAGEVPDGLSLDASGELSGTPTEAGSFTFTVTATDANDFSAEREYTLIIDGPTITVTVPSLPDGKESAEYGPVNVSASGGTEPYAFDLASGGLPEGMTLAPDGTIAGTPTEAGDFAVTIRATDNHGFEGSADATLRIEALNLPVARNLTLEVMAGTSGIVDLAQGATGGPFSGAAIAAYPASEAGEARIERDGNAHMLHFAAAGSFAGAASLTYTLSNASGTSEPATVTLTVIARPDPSLDPEVIGLIRAQTETAKRFANTQITNFNQRLEQLHDEGERRSNSIGVNVAVQQPTENAYAAREDMPFDPAVDAIGQVAPAEQSNAGAAAQAAPPVENLFGELAFWSGGFVNFGTNDDGAINLEHTLVGVSGGVDYRFTPQLTAGFGVGYGRDATDIGSNGTESRAEAFSLAAYGSYRPVPGFFLDGLAGYSTMNFDSVRFVTATGEFATGSRSGDQLFASLSAGYEYRNDGLLISPYGRLSGSHSTLDTFTETGAGMWNLTYGQQTIDTLSGTLGLRFQYAIPTTWGVLTPRGRLEYTHDFEGSSRASLGYADLGTTPYALDVDGFSRDHLAIGFGLDAQIGQSWNLGFDYRTAFGTNGESRDHTFAARLGVRF